MPLRQGDRLGRYEILSPLGAGGMGEVFRARDERLEREVAIKVLPDSVAQNPERLTRFEREAKAVAALSHPNILEIHDFGAEGDITFAVTELLEGKNLRQRLGQRPLDWRQAVEIGAAIADALAAAHRAGIVHRDLKPENVFLTRGGLTKVLDFGLAKAIRPEEGSSDSSEFATASMPTRAGIVLGTPGYMSPEQVRGQPVDHRTDIFALGCLLYEALSGRRAFDGDTQADRASAILSHPPAPLHEAGSDVPADVQKIVDRCLEKSPAKRFQDASDLSFALRSLVTDSESPVAAPPLMSRRAWSVVAAVCVVIVAITGAILLLDRGHMEPVPDTSGLDPDLVAVAVFENRTGDTELDHLGFMAADWITSTLGRIEHLGVVPLGMGLEARSVTTSPQIVAEETGAGIIVTGSYYLEGETLRFRATLTDATRGAALRSLDPVAGPVNQPMTVIETIASDVAGAVASVYTRWDLAFEQKMHPANLEAFQEYRVGLDLFAIDNRKAVEHFTRALELDPEFVPPALMKATALGNMGRWSETQDTIDRLEEHRHRMNNFERFLLGYQRAQLEGNIQQVVAQLRLCERSAPRSAVIKYTLASALLRASRPREALDVISAIEDPGLWAGYGTCTWPFRRLADIHHALGSFDEEVEAAVLGIEVCGENISLRRRQARALAALGKLDDVDRVLGEGLRTHEAQRWRLNLLVNTALELEARGHSGRASIVAERAVVEARNDPDFENSPKSERLRLVQALAILERFDETQPILAALDEEFPDDDDVLGWLGIVSARLGETAAAERYSELLRNLDRPYLFGWDNYYRAAIAAQLGRLEEALSLLRAAFSQGFRWRSDLQSCYELEPLRGHPEFEAILHPEG
jgi:tetratricopeptide (TPR) repeat protein